MDFRKRLEQRIAAQKAGKQIEMFFHCAQCIREKPDGVSAADWMRLETGLLADMRTLQVWCQRHNAEVIKLRTDGLPTPQ